MGPWSGPAGRANPNKLFLAGEVTPPLLSGSVKRSLTPIPPRKQWGGVTSPAKKTWTGERRAARGGVLSRPDERKLSVCFFKKMEIRSLEHTDFDTLFRGFEKAFLDYEIHFDKEEVRSMLKRRGYNPELSFAAFDADEIVAFTFNGTGTFNDIFTAYDTGTGTSREYRGKGLAKDIFKYSIPYLKEAGVGQYLLEVLQNNTKAISVYQKLGFRTTREFDCFRQKKNDINCVIENKRISPIERAPVEFASIADAFTFFDFSPSWQNSMESIERAGSDLVCLGAFVANELVGYCVFDPLTGDLSQIAVSQPFRRQGIASRLLRDMIKRTKSDGIKVLNVISSCHPMAAFLNKSNLKMTGKQFEMILPL